ncbi:hypothetical protein Cylst_6716 (plasmid) [Cylindrospermum stagnale PCC 7417]|uniref:Uncharacterized protein n=1 Tax=Cylindrospermum stagnale PCC 7417 TaxID=56107 RepID=K9X8R6_9NOST|nr:hypothetical protein [Cylindrospermum stagnale]AFZ28461.1 hypothetical protein Cylst_6716 [Cylindrospermum stagnale PCC 7417]
MQSIKIRQYIGQDGILHLEIPVGLQDKEIEVMVIYQPIEAATPTKTPEELGWPPGFFERTYGSCQDDPIVIDSEGNFEVREEIV